MFARTVKYYVRVWNSNEIKFDIWRQWTEFLVDFTAIFSWKCTWKK